MNHFEIKLALRVSDIIQSSSKWVFISGSRQMEGRNTHGMDHQSNSSFAAPPNIQLATKVVYRGCVGSHAVIAQPSAKVTADPSRRQIVVTWWKSISGSGSRLMTFDGIYCYLSLPPPPHPPYTCVNDMTWSKSGKSKWQFIIFGYFTTRVTLLGKDRFVDIMHLTVLLTP